MNAESPTIRLGLTCKWCMYSLNARCPDASERSFNGSAYKKLVAPSSIIMKSLLGSKESSLGLLVELDETAL